MTCLTSRVRDVQRGIRACCVGSRAASSSSTAVATAASPARAASPLAPAKRPNVLFILADDLGYGDLSCYGRPDYRTPVLDALRAAGHRSSRAPTPRRRSARRRAAPTSPGRYPQRLPVGLEEPLTARSPPDVGLPPDHPTVASLLKANGYDTSLVGKWHLGWKPEFGPNRHGFDEFFGILSGAADYFTHKRPWRAGSARGGAPDLWENLDADRARRLPDRSAVGQGGRDHRRARTRSRSSSASSTPRRTAPWEGPEDAAIGHTDARPGPDDRRRIAEDLRRDDEEHGRRHRPRAQGARAREARTRHARDLHERQRRRALLATTGRSRFRRCICTKAARACRRSCAGPA